MKGFEIGHTVFQAANTEIPALLAIEAFGYQIRRIRESISDCTWLAVSSNQRVKAKDPLSLLGLVYLLSTVHDEFLVEDSEMERLLPLFQDSSVKKE